jgi:hypothetical protein
MSVRHPITAERVEMPLDGGLGPSHSPLGERVEAEIRLLLRRPFCVHVGASIVAAVVEPRLERLALLRLVKKFVDLAIVNAELD